MGRVRWVNAGEQAEAASSSRPRGRPSKIENANVIRMVEAAFLETSQPSSRLCWNREQEEWMLAPCLQLCPTLLVFGTCVDSEPCRARAGTDVDSRPDKHLARERRAAGQPEFE